MKYIFNEYGAAITALISASCIMRMTGELLLGEYGVIAQMIRIIQGGG